MTLPRVTLAATLHDPGDRQLDQARRVLGSLLDIYEHMVVTASATTGERSVHTLQAAGVQVERDDTPGTFETLGSVRRRTLARAIAAGATHLHLCDWDRAIHWAEHYPEELREVAAAIPAYDCLILGRTDRAFDNHPRVQRDTERLINHCFGLVWGEDLDVTAASRGLSRRAAVLIVDGCDEPTIGNDGVWPLFLARQPGIVVGYARTEGLEWETPDRFGDEIAAAGGLDTWLANFDANVEHWTTRIELARIEVDAIRRWSRSQEHAETR